MDAPGGEYTDTALYELLLALPMPGSILPARSAAESLLDHPEGGRVHRLALLERGQSRVPLTGVHVAVIDVLKKTSAVDVVLAGLQELQSALHDRDGDEGLSGDGDTKHGGAGDTGMNRGEAPPQRDGDFAEDSGGRRTGLFVGQRDDAGGTGDGVGIRSGVPEFRRCERGSRSGDTGALGPSRERGEFR